MNVLYILDPAIIGGATKAFLTFISKLKDKGVCAIVCTAAQTELNDTLSSLGIKNFSIGHREMFSHYYNSRIGKFFWWTPKFISYLRHIFLAIKAIQKNVNLNDINIIHTNSTRSDVGFFLSKIYNKPHIVHVREFGDKDYDCHPLNPFWKSYYNNYSTKFLCVSKAVMNHWISKGIDSAKCELLYDGIAYEKILESTDKSKFDKTLKIVMSGSVLPTKGQYLAIKAIGSLPSEIKANISLDFIGWVTEDYKKELINLSVKSAIINPIKFWGARTDVLQLLKNYHIGLMCSKSEGFGLVTAEFMFAKLGVIASNTGASPELIENDVCGLNFETSDYKSLAEKILFYYNNRDAIVKHSNAAQEKASLQFKADTNAERIYKAYVDLLSSIPPKSESHRK